MMELKEVNITFPKKDPFIYFIYGKNDDLLFIGYTEDLNKKAFVFPFEYEKITGYYYPFRPVIEDEVDSLIIKRKPKYCRPRYGLKLTNLRHWIKEKTGMKFKKSEWKELFSTVEDDEIYIYEGEPYISLMGRNGLLYEIEDKYGTRNL